MIKRGDAIDIWIVDHALGQGGMGSVYRCHNRNAPRILAAVKVLDPSLRLSAGARQRFVREAEILFGLDHPNIVKVRNVRMDVPTPYLEMEFVDGIDLEQRLLNAPLSLQAAVDLIGQILSALAYLHSRGIQHRDIKPSNIILESDGRTRLVDFGIAAEADAVRLTTGDQAFGSVAYVPPEWSDSGADPALWDVYAAGLVFAEVLTGRPVYPVRVDATMQQEVVRILRAKQATLAVELPDRYPAALRTLVREMTRLVPTERMRDLSRATALLASLDGAAAPLPDLPSPEPPAAPPRRTITRPVGERTFRTTLPPAPPRSVGPTLVPLDEPVHRPSQRAHRRPAQVWAGLPARTEPTGGDPSYSTAHSKRARWLEVRWESPERFRFWCANQLVNYMLVLPGTAAQLPTDGEVRALLSHGDVRIDCPAQVQAVGAGSVSYRLDLDALQVEALHRWLARSDKARGA